MRNTDRHLELSSKFIEMGKALITEGKEKDDIIIKQSGNFFILLSGLMFDKKDIMLFSEFASMFSAKKVLEQMESDKHDFTESIKDKFNDDSYDEFIKRINDLRKDDEDDNNDLKN